MSAVYRFHQLDVFSNRPLFGNPLAVVHDATGIDDARMAAFARWTNLSETTFLLPPADPASDYRVRIFTPGGELPFAGHPTLGSCYAWLAAGGTPHTPGSVVQQCEAGLVRIRLDDGRLAFAAPPVRRTGELSESLLEQISRGLGVARNDIVAHQWVDNGPGWCAVMLRSAAQVLAIKPDLAVLRDVALGVIGPQAPGSDTDFEVRAFVAPLNVAEDPVTGSLNAGLAQWLMGAGVARENYVVSQGTALGRQGRVFLDKIGADIWVGGEVAVCIEGTVAL